VVGSRATDCARSRSGRGWTARRYVSAAQAEGLCRDAGVAALTDELLGAVVGGVRPARPNGHGSAWETLLGREEQISTTIF